MTSTPRSVRRLGLTAVAAGITACANPAADQAIVAQTALVGMPKATLLSCAGVPERQASADGREFFTYHTGRIVTFPATGSLYAGGLRSGWGYGGWGGWGWPAYTADVRNYTCEATFTLRGGVVERVVYGGGSDLGECHAIVQNCLTQTPRSTPPGTQ